MATLQDREGKNSGPIFTYILNIMTKMKNEEF